jgi:hypothetical protein
MTPPADSRMNDRLNQWLTSQERMPGVLGCGIRHADRTVFTLSFVPELGEPVLANTWTCVADTFQVFQLHRLPATRLRWVYQELLVHCAWRTDGACLTFLTTKDLAGVKPDQLESMLCEFQTLDD